MINYSISYSNPHRHYVEFQLTTLTNGADKVQFQLPAWRPGRYELANFAQNIQKWTALDENNNLLTFRKISKDLWEVDSALTTKITINYNFYANQLDAGSCYLDEHQLYLNPVQCMFYIIGRMDEEYRLNFEIPEKYKITSSMKKKGRILLVKGYDLLAESPIICSKHIQHGCFTLEDIKFNLWFQGECTPNWGTLYNDFKAFTQSQIKHFGGFPVDEYHFFFQITPYTSYHGVEHTKNTVLLLGPGKEIMKKRYNDLLGICSHELYHTWNIKAIRPKEMYPYNYTKENYFRTGFVAEGVTTYMGDLMLYSSGVFSWKEFAKTQNQNLERHLTNYGRYNLSVADSGFDNWLDGYKMGVPNRKTSIYPDAALCMLMVDLEIIKNSNGEHSLHTVMKNLYENFALKGKGYSENDFQNICVVLGGHKVSEIFKNHIYGTQDYIPSLMSALNVVGINLKEVKNPSLTAQYFGFISLKKDGKEIIMKVEPNSIADQCKIAPKDKIIKINGRKFDLPLNEILNKCGKEVNLTIQKKFSEKKVSLKSGNYYKLLEIVKNKKITKKQLSLRKFWTR